MTTSILESIRVIQHQLDLISNVYHAYDINHDKLVTDAEGDVIFGGVVFGFAVGVVGILIVR